MKTHKELDEGFADPELLKYNVMCYKCQKLSIECKCDDKWFRLRRFRIKLISARFNVGVGGAGSEDHKLVDRFGI